MKNTAICFHCVSKHTEEHSYPSVSETLVSKVYVQQSVYCLFIISLKMEKVYYVLYVLEYPPQSTCSVSHAGFHSLSQRKANAYKRLHKYSTSLPLKFT